MNYNDQLNSPQWKAKRELVLSRDKSKCRRCSNVKIGESAISGIIISVGSENKCRVINIYTGAIAFCYCSIKLTSIDEGRICFFRKTRQGLMIIGILNFSVKITPVNYFAGLKPNISEQELAEIVFDRRQSCGADKAISYLESTAPMDFDWLHVYMISVHHTYYMENIMAWEYPLKSLITLCDTCHNELHDNEWVPFYDEEGNKVKIITACPKCAGSGRLREYNHIEGGRCFRCNGLGYIER